MNPMSVRVLIQRLAHGEGLDLPHYATEHAAERPCASAAEQREREGGKGDGNGKCATDSQERRSDEEHDAPAFAQHV